MRKEIIGDPKQFTRFRSSHDSLSLLEKIKNSSLHFAFHRVYKLAICRNPKFKIEKIL
jgi:hypothetical protein